jgi:hypothetical protein
MWQHIFKVNRDGDKLIIHATVFRLKIRIIWEYLPPACLDSINKVLRLDNVDFNVTQPKKSHLQDATVNKPPPGVATKEKIATHHG